MNLKKILAGITAGALAVSAMSIASFATAEAKPITVLDEATKIEKAWDSKWLQFSVDGKKDAYLGYTVTFEVSTDCEYDDDNNMVSKVYSSNKDADGNVTDLVVTMAEEGKTKYTAEFTIDEDNIDSIYGEADWGTYVAFQFQCGHLAPITLLSVTAEQKAEEPTPSDSEEPTPSDSEEPTPSDSEEPTPSDSEEPTPSDSEETTPGDADETTPDDSNVDDNKPTGDANIEFTDVAVSGNDKHDAPVASVENDKVRLNIVHPWSNGEYVFADYKAFTGATVIQATITVKGVTDAFTAQLQGSNNSDPASFSVWGDSTTDKGTSTIVNIDKDGTYTLTLTSPEAIVESENFFLMVGTDLAAVTRASDVPEGLTITLDKLSVGVEKAASSESEETSASDTDTAAPATGTGSTNPGTGIAIAIVPAVIAAAGVIVAKKRK
ncbi:MAG: hypothetical protein HDT44_11250 [Ruminococcaceae bacterium]|nr:hypothetical protein [Oscillospiraceae bacterium]